MAWFVAITLGYVVPWLVKQTGTLMVAALATLIAAYYYWRRARLNAGIGRLGPAARRRSLARQLQLSLDMTAHFSLFPTAALRGYALADRFAKFV
jgi:hypothetical protein